MSTRYESSNNCEPRPPHCPSCAQIMRLARITSRFDDLPDLYTFECQACDVSHIEAEPSAFLRPTTFSVSSKHDRLI